MKLNILLWMEIFIFLLQRKMGKELIIEHEQSSLTYNLWKKILLYRSDVNPRNHIKDLFNEHTIAYKMTMTFTLLCAAGGNTGLLICLT